MCIYIMTLTTTVPTYEYIPADVIARLRGGGFWSRGKCAHDKDANDVTITLTNDINNI